MYLKSAPREDIHIDLAVSQSLLVLYHFHKPLHPELSRQVLALRFRKYHLQDYCKLRYRVGYIPVGIIQPQRFLEQT